MGRTAPAERFRQALGGEIASLLEVDADAREARAGGRIRVVGGDEGDVFRHAKAARPEPGEQPKRHLVVRGEDAGVAEIGAPDLFNGQHVGGRARFGQARAKAAFAEVRPEGRLAVGQKGVAGEVELQQLVGRPAPRRGRVVRHDAAWANAASNAAVFARAARKAGFRGVCLDHEDYTKQTQFRLSPGDPAYAEACRLARRRGRQFFAAFFSEFPEARLLAFWLFTEWREIVRARDVVQAAEEMKGDLWHAFLNGMLDVVPPSAKFIDGNETTGYKTAGGPDAFRAVEYVRVHACAGLTAADVVREMGMRTRTAENRFRSVAGHSIRDEIVAVRVARAQKLLLGSKAGVDSIFARCGYRDPRSLRYASLPRQVFPRAPGASEMLREARG